ncbi:MAG: DUF4386 domain-containing protein [Oscillochloris sp.]|nr:DUF4386 domain-containing protein [Oscillochloris sp.]
MIEQHTASPQRAARIAGVLYLVIIGAGMFAEFFVRSELIVTDEPAVTAANVIAAEGMFRAGIAADLLMIVSDIIVGLIFYVLLRPISQALALLAALFRLAQAAILGINLLNLFIGLELARPVGAAGALGVEQSQALALVFFRAHSVGYALALIFFGVYLFLLGYLILRSGMIPRLLGGLLMLAATGYLVDSFAQVVLPNYSVYAPILTNLVLLPAFTAELLLALWLLVKGVGGRQPQHVVATA